MAAMVLHSALRRCMSFENLKKSIRALIIRQPIEGKQLVGMPSNINALSSVD